MFDPTIKTVAKFLLNILVITALIDLPLFSQQATESERVGLIRLGYETSSQEKLNDRPSLEMYQKILLSNNLEIRAAYAAWRSEVRKIAVMRGLPDPRIEFGHFIQNIETAVGPQEWKLGIRQSIPWLGKLIVQGDIQARKADVAYQNLQGLMFSKWTQLIHLYWDTYFLNRALEVTRQNMELVRHWEAVTRIKYQTDIAQHSHLIKTQIEAAKLADDLESLKAHRRPLLEAFRALVNLPAMDNIYVPDNLIHRPLIDTKEQWLAWILEGNPTLKAKQSLVQVADRSVNRARLGFLPDFSIGVDKIVTGEKWNTSGEPVPDSGKDPLIVMGSASIPLWFGKHKASVAAAKHLKKKAVAETEDAVNQLKSVFEETWFQLDEASRKITLYQEFLIPKSLESLRISEKAYTSGDLDFMNIIDAQRRLLQFSLEFERAMVDFEKTRARLQALAGRTI